MAKEDYQVVRNGIEMNISQAVKQDKLKRGWFNFYKLKDRFDIELIENKNNILKISLYGNIYYYGLVKSKIRREGEKEWTGKLITTLKNDIQQMHNNGDY